MYQIGEFSKITKLTVKALRYYDEEKLLQPTSRGDNDYRLYNDSDFEKARLIIFLKSLEFSITEIKDVLNNYQSEADLQYFLQEKKVLILQKVKEQKALVKKIDHYFSPENIQEVRKMNYKMEVKEVEALTVVSIRYKGSYSDVGEHIGKLYKAAKSQVAGDVFNCYYDNEYKEIADIELCLPIKGNVVSSEVTVKKMPPIKALCTTHVGDYSTLNLAYKAVMDYAAKEGLVCTLPSREIYHKGPGMVLKGNPDKYETEIMIPIQ